MVDLIKKHKDMNWDGWEDIPGEEVFNCWIQKRVAKKKGNYPSPRAMNGIKTHINKLYREHGIEAEDAFGYAEDKAWDGIKAEWVIREHQKEQQGYFIAPTISQGPNVYPIQNRSTRDISLEESLSNKKWAE